MNRQEILLRNYILSEIYSIEKDLFLKENNCVVLSEGLLVEGRLWDWTKDLYKKVKSNFSLSPEENEGFDEMIEEAEAAGKNKRAKEIEEIRQGIESKRFRNQNILILGTIAVIIFNATGDFNKVKEALNDPRIDEINTNNPETARTEVIEIMDLYIPNFDESEFTSNQPVEASEEKKLNPVIIGLKRALELSIQEEKEWVANEERKVDELKKSREESILGKLVDNVDKVEETKKMKNRFKNMSGIVELEGLFDSYSEYEEAIRNTGSEAHKKILEAVLDIDQEALIDSLVSEALNHTVEDSATKNLSSLLFDLQEAPGDLDPEIKEIQERITQLRHVTRIASSISKFPKEKEGFDGDFKQKSFFKFGRAQGYIDEDGLLTDHPFSNAYYDIVNQ